MEISLLKVLLASISSYLHLSNSDCTNMEPVTRYYYKGEEILKLLKPILDAIFGSEISSDEILFKNFEELGQSIIELRELIEYWQPLSSKVYFVLQIESSLCKLQTSGIEVLQQLKASHQCLPEELSSASLEQCVLKIKHMGHERTLSTIKDAVTDQEGGKKPSSEILEEISESLCLKTNQDILIEAVALEKLKENAEQAENAAEAEYIDQIISLVTYMHERLVAVKQSESCSPVPIPADFCCPLSLELMTDPVIVASGQTYERVYIKNWIELGLTVCPKTRQTLAHTNLIPNYTVKALIANWCESNNVKLVEPLKPVGLSQTSRNLGHMESGASGEVAFAPSRINHLLDIAHSSIGAPAKNSISSAGAKQENMSPLHPQSISDGFLPAANVQSLDIARLSRTGSNDRPTDAEESVSDIDDVSFLPSREEFSNSTGEDKPQPLIRSTPESSTLPDANISQVTPLDGNDTSQVSSNLTGYSSDASVDINPGPDAASTLAAPHREPEFPPRLMETRSRNQSIWRRPSERFMPRMVSSPASETRTDLTAIENQVRKLVEELQSSSLDTQREATSQLRLLAKHNMDNRIVIANCGAISLLVNLLCSTDTVIQENAVTSLLNLSINDNNKNLIANADAIDPLIHVLETGSPEAKENSAATLFSLSVIEENKIKIGRSRAIRPLVDLLGNGTPRGKKDAATALFNLSIFHENKGRIVLAGAVKHLVDLMDPAAGMVDKAVAVLANLATIPEGRTAIGQENGIPVLVEVVELGSARGKENAAAALLHLCQNSGRFCSQVLQEGAVPPLVALSQSGTPRAKEKAQALLSYFRNQRHGNAGRV